MEFISIMLFVLIGLVVGSTLWLVIREMFCGPSMFECDLPTYRPYMSDKAHIENIRMVFGKTIMTVTRKR